MAVGAPDPVDVHVGSRLRLARTASGLTLAEMGTALGMSSQQAQKYEKGINRLGSRRLYQLAQLFDLSVDFFFRDMPAGLAGPTANAACRNMPHRHDMESLSLGPGGKNQEVLRLVTAFLKVPDPALRAEMTAFVLSVQKSLAAKAASSGR